MRWLFPFLLAVALLPACGRGGPTPAKAPGPEEGLHAGSGGGPAKGGTAPVRSESGLTWTIRSLDEPWLQAPHTAAITLPHRFRIRFSGPVDRASVEAALNRNLGVPYKADVAFVDDETLDVTVVEGPHSSPWQFIPLTPAGGKDRDGARLAAQPDEGQILLSIRPSTVISRWSQGKPAEEVARLRDPFDVLSVSADGTRFALRRIAMPAAGGLPPVGPPVGHAYWFDAVSGRLERVEGAHFWLTPHWLPDGALLMAGTDALTLVSPSGEQRPIVVGEQVVHVRVDPDGERVAVLLAGQMGEPGALWIVHLETGERQEYPEAFTPSYSPAGVPRGVALWSPNGQTLVYTEGTEAYGEVRLVELTPSTGARRILLEGAGRPVSWAPSGAWLYVHDVGVLAMPEGRLVLPAHGTGGFSPDGSLLVAGGVGLVTVPDWEPLHTWDPLVRHAVWSPDGAHLVLWDGGLYADLYAADGRLVMRVNLPDRPEGAEAPEWSPDGRYLTLAGVRLVDTRRYRLGDLPEGLGRPVGWSEDGSLYLGWGREYGDSAWWNPGW